MLKLVNKQEIKNKQPLTPYCYSLVYGWLLVMFNK